MEIDIERVRELVSLAANAGISELTVVNGAGRITIKKSLAVMPPVPVSEVVSAARIDGGEGTPSSQTQVSQSGETARAETVERFVSVKAQVVGIVYLGERPDAEPMVRAGQRVKEGQMLCVVEAMKVRNEVTAPVDGIVAQILVENGQPVEYGHELMILESEPPLG